MDTLLGEEGTDRRVEVAAADRGVGAAAGDERGNRAEERERKTRQTDAGIMLIR